METWGMGYNVYLVPWICNGFTLFLRFYSHTVFFFTSQTTLIHADCCYGMQTAATETTRRRRQKSHEVEKLLTCTSNEATPGPFEKLSTHRLVARVNEI